MKIYLAYSSPPFYTGLVECMKKIKTGLTEHGIECCTILFPVLNRKGWMEGGISLLRLVIILPFLWIQIIVLLLFKKKILICLGQSWSSIIQIGIPYFLGNILNSKKRGICVTGGHIFMEWSTGSLISRIFCSIGRQSKYLTVLSEKQKAKMAMLGLLEEKVLVVMNSCDIHPLTKGEIERKHQNYEPIKILYLSSLIETKGYPLFLNALEKIANQDGPKIEAIICGTLVAAAHGQEKFKSLCEAEKWVIEMLGRINKSKRVNIKWIKGAYGSDKEKLYREAHIFVFPSFYKVEAQPIVLIEAMASGATIITSTAGVIAETLNECSAIFLDQLTEVCVARAIETLAHNHIERVGKALQAQELFCKKHSSEQNSQRWASLVESID